MSIFLKEYRIKIGKRQRSNSMMKLTDLNGIQIATPDPLDEGGLALNGNFKAAADRTQDGSTAS